MNNYPLISVVMPVHNAEQYISEAVESILEQTYQNFEFIIIDDGSFDGSLEKIQSFSDSRIKLIIHSTNKGIVCRLNEGISLANGEFIARMDADDVALPLRFEKQVKYLSQNPEVAVLGTQIELLIEPEKRLLRAKMLPTAHEEIVSYMLFYCPLVHPSCVLRIDLLKNNPYPDVAPIEDYKLWTLLAPGNRFANLPETLLYHRRHTGNQSNRFESSGIRMIFQVQLEKWGIPFTQEQLETHLSIFDGNPKMLSYDDLLSVRIWLNFLKKINKEKHLFKQASFEKLINMVYLECWLWKVKSPIDYLRLKESPVFYKKTSWRMRWRLFRSFMYKLRNTKNA